MTSKHRIGQRSAAGEVVLAYLAEQVGVLRDLASEVLADAPDAVHRSRVATRRLRSALRTYAPVLEAAGLDALRAELRWHAEALGAPRDAEVLTRRLLAAAEELPPTTRAGVVALLGERLGRTHAEAHADLERSMRTKRYRELRAALEQLVGSPVLSPLAGRRAADVLPPLLEQVVGRVARLAGHAASRPNDLTRWHEVRKAAKAARYGAEVLLPVLPERAERLRAEWQAVTEAFGEVQDAVVAQQVIGDLSWEAVGQGLARKPFDDLRHQQDGLLREALATGRTALAEALG